MPATDESALALAGQLRALTDAQLAELFEARELRERSINDFFDLADALLDPDSIQHALGRLQRPTLATLAALSELGSGSTEDAVRHLTELGAPSAELAAHLATLQRLALVTLVEGGFSVPASVTAQLCHWPALGLPDRTELLATPAPATLAPVSQADERLVDAVAADQAFHTTAAIAELVAELQREPARELVRGGVALPDSKRLAASMGADLDRVPGLLEIASRAGLVVLEAGRWMPTGSSARWLVDGSGERWALLANAWLEGVPADIREILRRRAHATWGERLREYVQWLFPAGGEWMRSRVDAYARDAALLGITAENVPSTPGVALLSRGAQPAAEAMSALFPPEVEQVYLQDDLSIVSPGPLAPRIDARLRTLAEVESRALASRYRVSTASLTRALAAGETSATITEFLRQISLTGIPQPLAYLISEATVRFGLVRVGELPGGRAYVSSTDSTLLRTILVDQALAPLGLSADGTRLLSRFDRDLVFWSLAEARYPVAAEDTSGAIVVLRRRQASRTAPTATADTADALIQKLRLGSSSDPETTGREWLSRQLEIAIRSKIALTVTVKLPSGATADYQLEPASMGSGRLRARDRKADIERTLPVASITAISPACSAPAE